MLYYIHFYLLKRFFSKSFCIFFWKMSLPFQTIATTSMQNPKHYLKPLLPDALTATDFMGISIKKKSNGFPFL